MGTGIPLPALSVKPVQQPDIMESAGRLLQLRSLMQGQQAQGMQLQQQQMALDDQQKVRSAFLESGGDMDKFYQTAAQSGVAPQTLLVIKNSILEQRQKLASLSKSEIEATQAKSAAVGQAAGSLLQLPPEQRKAALPGVIDGLVKNGIMDAPSGQQFIQQSGQLDDASLEQQLKLHQFSAMAADKQLSEIRAEQEAKATLPGKQAESQMKAEEAKLSPVERSIKGQSALEYYAAKGDPLAQKALQKKIEVAKASRPVTNFGDPGSGAETPIDSNSQSILAQTGLSLNAFRVITGQGSQLPRDANTRNRASFESQKWLNAKGIDSSTIASQYKSYNSVLEKNIERLNNTKIMEDELRGTVQNLQGVVTDQGLSRVKFANVAKIWAGEQVNDDLASQYAFHLGQLRNELAAYYAAAAGRPGSSITITDLNEATNTIKNGISSGGLQGIAKSVENSTAKMGPVMQRSVDSSQRAIWNLFGVGDKYKGKSQQNSGGGGVVEEYVRDPKTGKLVRK